MREYSPEVKAAVMAALMEGQSLRQIEREHGVPKSTVERWGKDREPDPQHSRESSIELRDALIVELLKRLVTKPPEQVSKFNWSQNIPKGKLDTAERYVYLVRESWNNFVKIGIASDLYARVASMQTCCPQQLTIVGYVVTPHAKAFEQQLHQRFSHKHHSGEWFELSSIDIQLILDYHDGFVAVDVMIGK